MYLNAKGNRINLRPFFSIIHENSNKEFFAHNRHLMNIMPLNSTYFFFTIYRKLISGIKEK